MDIEIGLWGDVDGWSPWGCVDICFGVILVDVLDRQP